MKKLRIAGLLVAAGNSSRMNDFKPLLEINGKPMIKHVIDNLQGVGVNQILVITGKKADILEPYLDRLRIPHICNKDYQHTEMFVSALLGFNYFADKADAVFFQPADIPLVRKYSLIKMIETLQQQQCTYVQPYYKQKKGHPVLISQRCFNSILTHDGENGLRGALEKESGLAVKLELPDRGIVMDADTPADFSEVCRIAANREIPDETECIDILQWHKCSAPLINHCIAVKNITESLIKLLNQRGYNLNLQLAVAGALLHDIEKGKQEHDIKGEQFIRSLGFTQVAEIVGAHFELPEVSQTHIDEKSLVYFADKIIKESKRVTIETRFLDKLESYKGKKDIYNAIISRMNTALEVQKMILDACQINTDSILTL